jgi:hypothetical protein
LFFSFSWMTNGKGSPDMGGGRQQGRVKRSMALQVMEWERILGDLYTGVMGR